MEGRHDARLPPARRNGHRFAGVCRSPIDLLARDDGSGPGERPWGAAIAEAASRSHDDVATLPPAIAARARELGVLGCWLGCWPGETGSALEPGAPLPPPGPWFNPVLGSLNIWRATT